MSLLRIFTSDARGTVAVAFGIALPAFVGAAGLAVDYARYTTAVANLQGLADSASIAAVSSITVANMSGSSAEASVQSYVAKAASDSAWQNGTDGITVDTNISDSGDQVTVTLSQNWKPMLVHLISDVQTPVKATSTAKLVGSGKACVIGLETFSNATVHMDDTTSLTGKGCGVFSNSTHKNSVLVEKDANLTASMICSAGGALVKKKGNVSPDVILDCPPLADPLAGRLPPTEGPCKHHDLAYGGANPVTLEPGTFCGGLTLSGTVAATSLPGVYIIKDGSLILEDSASLQGTGVGFYLAGDMAALEFGSATSVSLEAPVDGDMAGLLFFEDRSNKPVIHKISSADAKDLLGTIYLPKSTLEVAAVANVGEESAYTALIVNKLRVFEGPNVVLNSDYDATDVPVPPGLLGGKVVLTN